ncbi:MAG: AAA family ATPase [Candidatus Pacebacteria bacterium]|nr:AAA family ATPase [Candidatus Paceibacterota bacterium]
MKIIEKIEIKNFRSFLGNTEDDRVEILELIDLNIFSGANDSGKSNVLRALNLFFNDEISVGEKFIFDRDFSASKKDDYRKVIEIKVYFDLIGKEERDKFLPEKFSISKFYSQGSNNKHRDYLLEGISKNGDSIKIFTNPDKNKNSKAEKQYRQHLLGFLNNISFEYVPAIKDKYFFSRLFGRTILEIKKIEDLKIEDLKNKKKGLEKWEDSINKNKKLIKVRSKKIKLNKKPKKNNTWNKEIIDLRNRNKDLKNKNFREKEIGKIDTEIQSTSVLTKSIDSLKDGINLFSKDLFLKVSKFLPSEFQVSQDFESFFEEFDIGTGSEKEISLKLRGDGMQAKFIPEVLNFLNKNQNNKKYFIWGFEEPENSSEYFNQQELAKKFKEKFCTEKQIFITTHSEEFLSIYDGVDIKKEKRKVNLYHVKKIKKKKQQKEIFFSLVELFDVEKNIFKFATVKANLEKDLGTSLIRAKYSKELKEKEKEFFNEKEKYEAKRKELEKEIAKSKKPLIFVEGKFDKIYLNKAWDVIYPNKNMPFDILQKNGKVIISEIGNYVESTLSKKLIAIFDNDHSGFQYFELKTNNLGDNFNFYKDSNFIKKHKKENIWVYLLQTPDSRKGWVDESRNHRILEMEHLFEDSFITKLGIKLPKTISPTAKEWKVGDKFKKKLGERIIKLKFTEYGKKDFKNFKPLFDKIKKLLAN